MDASGDAEGSQERLPTETLGRTRMDAGGDVEGSQGWLLTETLEVVKDGCWRGYKDRNEKNN